MELLQPLNKAEVCLPPAENRCNKMKVKVPKLWSALSEYRMKARQTHAMIRRESAEARWQSRCCTWKEEYNPMWVDTSTVP